MEKSIISKVISYLLRSDDFKRINNNMDKSTNNGKDFEVDSEENYGVLLFDIKTSDIDIDLLPTNTEYILIISESSIMSVEFSFIFYVNGEFIEADEDTNESLEEYGFELIESYDSAIMSLDYGKWIKIKKKAEKVILDINENVDSNLRKDFIKYIITDSEYMKINKEIDEHDFGYYHAELYSSRLLRTIHMYPGVMKVPDNLVYFVMIQYQISEGFKRLFHVYDKKDGFRLPTEKEEEIVIKNDSAQQFSSNNFNPILRITTKEYLEVKDKQSKLFQDINESVDNKMMKSFNKIAYKSFSETTRYEHYDNVTIFKVDSEYIMVYWDNGQDGRILYRWDGNEWVVDKLEPLIDLTSGDMSIIPIMTFNHLNYIEHHIKVKDTQEELFKNINENLVRSFSRFKRGYING